MHPAIERRRAENGEHTLEGARRMDRRRRSTIGRNIEYGYRGSAIIVALGPLPLPPISGHD